MKAATGLKGQITSEDVRAAIRAGAEIDNLTARDGPVSLRNHRNLNRLAHASAIEGDPYASTAKADVDNAALRFEGQCCCAIDVAL